MSTSSSDSANNAYVVCPYQREPPAEAETSLAEMIRLCQSAGLTVVGSEIVRVRTPTGAFFLGTGQMRRVAQQAEDAAAGVIIFDRPITPAQMRNWARETNCEIYDRHGVILEIFAQRAKTRDAQLQVELARAGYAQSHVVGMWQHLSRQGGGSRLARGEGEKQIEMDRRRLAERVTRAQRGLEKLTRQRTVQRARREHQFRAALVGYTNAGKSSLLNALSHARVAQADQLFATLDPTTRRLFIPPDSTILLTDTVGFVRNLPPQLVQAFHSTLEEALEAQVILHVVDMSDDEAFRHIEVTNRIMAELGADTIPQILVLNKADRCTDPREREMMFHGALPAAEAVIPVSARAGTGIPELRELLVIAHQRLLS
jgi:GTP-binding protein HflX